jgi:hypothetical protein
MIPVGMRAQYVEYVEGEHLLGRDGIHGQCLLGSGYRASLRYVPILTHSRRYTGAQGKNRRERHENSQISHISTHHTAVFHLPISDGMCQGE